MERDDTWIRLLRPDNFTPPSRTPWGGHAIVGSLKAGLGLGVDARVPVGESWEISTEPSFPSVLETGESLEAIIQSDVPSWLGERTASEHGGTPLLVKIIDAAEDLSVQVHPSEGAALADDECGKTEAWIVLAARPRARIYLGFRDGVHEFHVAECLERGGEMNRLMNDVPVRPGDVFLIRPGLAHAIGAGATILEVQRVRPRRRTITYRFWDWNRRYDETGTLDPAGQPRPLHITEALTTTDWAGPRGESLVAACRRPVTSERVDAALTRWRLLDEPELWGERWTGTGTAQLPAVNTLLGILCLDGRVELSSRSQHVQMAKGQTAVVAAAAAGVSARLDASDVVTCCIPTSA